MYILEYLNPLFWFHLTPLFLRFAPLNVRNAAPIT